MIDDLRRKLEDSRGLGIELATDLVNIQQPNCLLQNEQQTEELILKADSWLRSCNNLESLTNARLAAIKAQKRLKFWKEDTTHKKLKNLFDTTEADTKKESEEDDIIIIDDQPTSSSKGKSYDDSFRKMLRRFVNFDTKDLVLDFIDKNILAPLRIVRPNSG